MGGIADVSVSWYTYNRIIIVKVWGGVSLIEIFHHYNCDIFSMMHSLILFVVSMIMFMNYGNGVYVMSLYDKLI